MLLRMVVLFCGTAACVSLLPAAAQVPADAARPSTPAITLIVPSDESGAAARIAGIVADALTRAAHAPVRVKYIPGVAGVTGTNAIAAAAPDGMTLGLALSTPMIGAKLLSRAARYNPLDDFDWLALFGTYGNALVVRADNPAKSFAGWLASARASPNALRYGTGGIASAAHIAGEYLHVDQHANLVHVPFEAASQEYAALASDDIDALIDALPSARVAADARQFRVLAVTSSARDSALPGVPAFAEMWPGRQFEMWAGIVAPAHLPAAAHAQVAAAVTAMLADAGFARRLTDAGLTWRGLSAADTGVFIRDDIVRMARQIGDMAIQPAPSP
ncbi:MAG TPA: tripartite tricarboxylate transporter substrate binding protein [Casimicrobiaceae bacterium]